MSETLQTTVASRAAANPLLKAWQTPFETPPFAEIVPEHFLPAFEQAFADHSAEITAIEHDPATPDFANTITELERSGKLLSRVSAVFHDLVSAHSNSALLEIDKEVSLRKARHWNPIMMNAMLFGREAAAADKPPPPAGAARPSGRHRGAGRSQRARHGRQGDRDAVAVVSGDVPEELPPARPAREGVQGLHRAWRQRQRQ